VFLPAGINYRKLFAHNCVDKIDKDIAGQLNQLRRYGV
jgi:hypothetical protein